MFDWLRKRSPHMTDARADRFAYGFAEFNSVPFFVRDEADLPHARADIEAGIAHLIARELRIAEGDPSQRWEIRGRVQSLRNLLEELNQYVQIEPQDRALVREANAQMADLGSDAPDDEVTLLAAELGRDPRYRDLYKYDYRRHDDATSSADLPTP